LTIKFTQHMRGFTEALSAISRQLSANHVCAS
jgi:hypothetical protein